MKNPLKAQLDQAFAAAERIALLGCGSHLRGDDAAGVVIVEALEDLNGTQGVKTVQIFNGDVAPENQTGGIKEFKPDLVLLIDAVDMDAEPGTARLISSDKIKCDGVSFSSHMMPMAILIDYLIRETGCSVMLLGIQAKSLDFMAELTPAVATTVKTLITNLQEALTA